MEKQVITAADVGTIDAAALLEPKPRYICKGERATKERVEAYRKSRAEEAALVERRLEAGFYPEAARPSWEARLKLLQDEASNEQLVLRRECGRNLADLIEAVPEDGLDHFVECPSCGGVVKVTRVPVADLEPAESP